VEGLAGSNEYHLVVADHITRKELEDAMLGSVDRCYIPLEFVERRAKLASGLTKDPPVFAIGGAAISISLRFNVLQQVLISFREALPNLTFPNAKEIYDHLVPNIVWRFSCEITAIPIGSYILFEAVPRAYAKLRPAHE
jgi:hypothetical protein